MGGLITLAESNIWAVLAQPRELTNIGVAYLNTIYLADLPLGIDILLDFDGLLGAEGLEVA